MRKMKVRKKKKKTLFQQKQIYWKLQKTTLAPQQLSSAVCEVARGKGMASFQRQLEPNWWAGEGCTACLTQVTAQVPNRWAKAPMFVSEAAVGWGRLCQELTTVVKGCSCSSYPASIPALSPCPLISSEPSGQLVQRGEATEKYPTKMNLFFSCNCFLLVPYGMRRAPVQRRGGTAPMGMGTQGVSQAWRWDAGHSPFGSNRVNICLSLSWDSTPNCICSMQCLYFWKETQMWSTNTLNTMFVSLCT